MKRKPRIFNSTEGVQVIFEDGMPRGGKDSMIEKDPPEHSRYRKILIGAFSPKTVASLTERVHRIVAKTLDRLEGKPSFDLVEEFATPIPLEFFYNLVGVPKEDQRDVLSWPDQLFFAADLRHGGDPEGMKEAGLKLQAHGRQLAEEKREHPGDDIMNLIGKAQVDGERLTIQGMGTFFGLIGGAGADTTRSALSRGVNALCHHPEQRDLWLQDIEGHADTAVEEIVRCATPTMHIRRTALQDTEFGGKKIAKGDKVVLCFMSGNRDAVKFDDPFRFDITRNLNPRMGFGMGGPYFWIGAQLARLQLKIALTELLKRFPKIRHDSDTTRLRSNFINGPETFRVSV